MFVFQSVIITEPSTEKMISDHNAGNIGWQPFVDLLDSSIIRYTTDVIRIKFEVRSACRIVINVWISISKLLYISGNRHGCF